MIGTGCILDRAPRTKETLPDFHEWCRVTRHPRISRWLTGCQQTPRFWGVTKTKHIDTKYNFLKDMVARKEVNVKYITTQEMVLDPFTKPMPKEAYFRHVKSLGLRRH